MQPISLFTHSYNPYAQNNSNNKSSANIIDATIDELLNTGIRAPLDDKAAFGLLQKISTNLEDAKFDSLSSLVEWAKEHPNDTLGVSEFLYKVFDQHEAKVGEDRLLTVQKSIEKAINTFTARQGSAFEIREYDVLGSLLGECSMSELLAFAECNIRPDLHPADATPVELFFTWLRDLKQNFHDFQPIRDNSWLKGREFVDRPDVGWAPKINEGTFRVLHEITNILHSDKNITVMGIYEKLAEKGINDSDIYDWTSTVKSNNPVLYTIAHPFQRENFFKAITSPNFKKPGRNIICDTHLRALLGQKTVTSNDYHQAFIYAGYTETEIKEWAAQSSPNYMHSGNAYFIFRSNARNGVYERASMREQPALP